MINFHVKVKESRQQLEKILFKQVKEKLGDIFPQITKNVKKRLIEFLGGVFQETPEYDALVNGDLDKHFGIPQGTAKDRLDSIIRVLKSEVVVEYKPNARTFGEINVSAVKDDFSGILGLGAAHVDDLPWLKWLLLEGNRIIVSEHSIFFTTEVPSRSGGAIMVKSNSRGWKVPSEYAGTESDNWITRALENSRDLINGVIESAISEVIRSRL